MQEPTFLILTVLAMDSRHGYGIIKEVERLSSGRLRLRPGTLYRALDRLRADGLVWVDREEIVQSRLRRYYGLTPKGERRLADEAARFRSDAAVALARLGLGQGESRATEPGGKLCCQPGQRRRLAQLGVRCVSGSSRRGYLAVDGGARDGFDLTAACC
jgi:DNA-binding PadR family transcriptional regulator